jgi:hypothetical protein
MIDWAFALAVITADTVSGAVGLIVATVGQCAFLFPSIFVQSADGEQYAAKARYQRLLGLVAVVCGIMVFTARHHKQLSIVKLFFPPANSRGPSR